ncbi:TonB-dependent receptor [Alteromonas gilva]|uniref:TonB-dependent receptor n=1 Tax=Alteromonas gilva TaxID=2987522 RepID=A0ABT5KXM8_9ALTE|nr:TonB-dependent receptor [Alteromonas gilva]MDC8829525.1 TonB-dependent receptor [Alteromonas gilva]
MTYQRTLATLSIFSLFSSLLLLALPARGQSNDDTVPDNIERITTTGSRTGTDNQNAPLVISAVSRDELALLSPTHIEEALKFIAGAQVQRGNGQEYLPALRSQVFTGAGACGGLLTAEDGIPLRAAGFCNINELFEAHSEMAAQIEVLKGPGSALYGSNAVHGVINVITPDTTLGGGMAGVDYGSYGYSRYKLRAGHNYGDGGVGINTSITRDTGYREQEGVDQEKINLRHQHTWDDVSLTTGLTYTNLDQETAGYITGLNAYKDPVLARSNENPEAFRKASALRIWSRLQWQLNNGDTVSVTPYVRDQDMQFLMHFLPGTPLEENTQQGAGVQSLWAHAISDTLTLNTGVDIEFTEGTLLQSQDGPTEGSAFLTETIPAGKHYDYTVDASLYAGFAELEWQQQKWLVSAGIRYEYMGYDYTNNMNSGRLREDGSECGFGGCRYSRPPSGDNSFTNASPKLGATYIYSDTTRWYANYSLGYRAPQATELYRLQRAQQVADLASEKARNLEVGIKGDYPSVRYTVSAYTMDKDNFIFRDSDFFYVNDGKTRHTGIELELDWQLSEHWDIAVAATAARHTYEFDRVLNDVNINGNDIDTAPRVIADVRLGYQLADTTRVELEWNRVDDYYTDPENLHRYEGHELVNIRASWQVTPQLTMFARVNNALDTAYAERADFTSFGGDRYFPGRPRNYLLSLTYRWF